MRVHRSTYMRAAGLALSAVLAVAPLEATAKEFATSLVELYTKLGEINGERGSGPVICFPSGVTGLSKDEEWIGDRERRQFIRESLHTLGELVRKAYRESG